MENTIGIDLSKDTLDVHCLSDGEYPAGVSDFEATCPNLSLLVPH